MEFDIDFFNKLDFSGSVINLFQDSGNDVWFSGDFAVGDIPYFGFTFKNCGQKRGEFKSESIKGAKITRFEITEGDLYGVSISFDSGVTLEFFCKWIYRNLKMYKGTSYKNVYSEWEKYLDKIAYVESSEYFADEEDIELPEGYSLNVKTYTDRDDHAVKAVLSVFELTENGKHIFAYRCTYDHPCACKGLLYHSNGCKYLPFQVDLYGISYLDLESGEVFNYIPEGCEHDIDQYCGESFIITDIHYDKDSDLVAYGGCYWAFPYGVMVGDFSDPLNFDPHLISIYDLIMSEIGEGSEVVFVRFDDGKLVVKTDDNNERAFCLNELKVKIRALSE